MTSTLSERLARLDLDSLSPEHARIIDTLASDGDPPSENLGDFLPAALQESLELPPLRQTHWLEGERIHSITYVLFPGVDAADLERALLEEEWSWWKNGRISKWSRRDDGSCTFILAPVWPFVPSKVGIELAPRATGEQPVPWGSPIPVVSSPARFFADFEGPGRYEILGLEGGCALRSVWDGVARLGLKKLMPLSMILNMHLGAEAGTLAFPLPKGTGFPGLARKLGTQAEQSV